MHKGPSFDKPSDGGGRVALLRSGRRWRYRGLPLVMVLAGTVFASIAILALHT